MRSKRIRAIGGFLLCLGLVSGVPALAEGRLSLGLRGGIFDPTGSPDTFDAVYGGDTMPQFGLDFRVRLGRSWRAHLAADHGTLDGELVIVTPSGPVGTGVETQLTLTPVHLSIERLFRAGRPWSLYLGAGPTYLDWEDDNDFETTSGSDLGYHAVFGAERNFGQTAVGGEVRYSTISDAIGEGGASQFFGEDDLGGVSLHLVVSYRIGS
ncbi:MAG: porin family protein [Thermoanaerobaculia bacterium]|nr:porin family protein [Thermoanaerobaculia bacterium]